MRWIKNSEICIRTSPPAKFAALAAICLLASGGLAEANLFTRFFSAFRPPHHRYATSQRQKRGDDAATSASPRITTGRPVAIQERPAAAVRAAARGNPVLPAAKEAGGGKLLTGVLVPDKPGFLRSPYTQNQAVIDVRGFPSGTKVTDPSTGKTFLTP